MTAYFWLGASSKLIPIDSRIALQKLQMQFTQFVTGAENVNPEQHTLSVQFKRANLAR
jgi:hypothetical protein